MRRMASAALSSLTLNQCKHEGYIASTLRFGSVQSNLVRGQGFVTILGVTEIFNQ